MPTRQLFTRDNIIPEIIVINNWLDRPAMKQSLAGTNKAFDYVIYTTIKLTFKKKRT